MEREFDAYKLSRCMCPSNYNHFWDTARYLWKKIGILSHPLAFDAPVRRLPSEYRHPVWYGKTRMVSLPEGEKISKICLFVLTWSMNVTDGQADGRTDGRTLHDSIDRACIASRGKNWRLLNHVETQIKIWMLPMLLTLMPYARLLVRTIRLCWYRGASMSQRL